MGWFTQLLRIFRTGDTAASASMDTIRVVTAYVTALATPRGPVTDASRLPYAKPHIKRALVRAMGLATQTTMREELRAAYLKLAEWQEDADTHPEALQRVAAESRQLSEEIAQLTQ